MAFYRLYHRGLNGGINSSEDIEASDDDAAIALAKASYRGEIFELWSDSRHVANLMAFNSDGSKTGEPVVILADATIEGV